MVRKIRTLADIEEGRRHYASLSLKKLKQLQWIVQAQIPLAFEQRREGALADLQTMDDLIAEAIYNKAFEEGR